MANSRYEYVRSFELPDALIPCTWIVVRIDGRGFHKFSDRYGFEKPNDHRALELMNAAAMAVMRELSDIVISYGISDEFSFVFHQNCTLFERRREKLLSTVVSTFSIYYGHFWPSYFPDLPLKPPLPSFDGRVVIYPTVQALRDYLSWRQVDCHINNLYNTTFWALVQRGGMSQREAEERLKGTVAADKNEILFSQFGINYNNEPEIYKKGSVLFRDYELQPSPLTISDEQSTTLEADPSANPSGGPPATISKTAAERERKKQAKTQVAVQHLDIIQNDFWDQRPWILQGRAGIVKTNTNNHAERVS